MARHRLILLLSFFLVVFGLVMVGNASIVTAFRDFGDQWYYIKLQTVWAIVGLLGLWFAGKFDHRKLEKLSLPLFVVTLFLLVIVLIPGIGLRLLGARRWINLGLTSFQPAELAKISILIYLAALFRKNTRIIPFLTIISVVGALIMFEPDLGTMLVLIGASVITYFVAAEKSFRLVLVAPVGLVLIALLIVAAPYRLNRVKSFLDYSHDPQGASYQIRQSLLALGSGGLWGVGLGQSRQKFEYLPESTTDSIFAIVGEELGFIWASALIIVYLILVYQGLLVARSCTDPFSRNLAVGISAMVGLQAFINFSAITALFPLTGIPLPLISYGGSSLVIILFSLGILINIAKANQHAVKK